MSPWASGPSRTAPIASGSSSTIRSCVWSGRSAPPSRSRAACGSSMPPSPRAWPKRAPSRCRARCPIARRPSPMSSPDGESAPATLSYAAALVAALDDALASDARVSIIGTSILGLGSHRGLLQRLHQAYPDRIVPPPIAEASLAAIGAGAAMAGARPFVDFGAAAFSYLAWSQLVNEAAVAHYMSGGRLTVPVTYHALHGVRGAGGPQHSHSPQAMLCNAPGLEIVVPSTAADVYGLLR